MERADKAAIKSLLRERTARLRELQATGRDADIIHLAPAQGAQNKTGLDGAEESLSHVLVRTCAQGYIVRMSSAGEEGLPVNVQHDSLAMKEALNLLLDTLKEKPKMLEHMFDPRSRTQQETETAESEAGSATRSDLESTTVDLWLGPRMLSASVALYLRCSDLPQFPATPSGTAATAKELDGLRDTADDLLLKLVEVLTMSIERADQHENVRVLLTEFLQTTVEAFLLLSDQEGSSSTCLPWPVCLALLPADRRQALRNANAQKEDIPLVAFFRNGTVPGGTQLSPRRARPTDLGKGLANAWMPEDRTPFVPSFCADSAAMHNTAHHVIAQTLLICSVHVTRQLAFRFPALLSDLGDLAERIFADSWSAELKRSHASLHTLPPALVSLRHRIAAQAFTYEQANAVSGVSHSLSLAAVPAPWLRQIGGLACHSLALYLKDSSPDIVHIWSSLGSIFAALRRSRPDTSRSLQPAIDNVVQELKLLLPNLILELTEARARDLLTDSDAFESNPENLETLKARKSASFEAVLLVLERSLPASSPLRSVQLQALYDAVIDPDFCQEYSERHSVPFRHPWLTDLNAVAFKKARERILSASFREVAIDSTRLPGVTTADGHSSKLNADLVDAETILSAGSLAFIDDFSDRWAATDHSASERLATTNSFALYPCALTKSLRRTKGDAISTKLKDFKCQVCDVVPTSAANAAASRRSGPNSHAVQTKNLKVAVRSARSILESKVTADRPIVIATLEAARRCLEHLHDEALLQVSSPTDGRKRQKRRRDSQVDVTTESRDTSRPGRSIDVGLQRSCEQLIGAALQHYNRDVRMAAGRLANTFVRRYSSVRDCAQTLAERVGTALGHYTSILSSLKSNLSESTIISLSMLGRIDNEGVLAKVLELLVLQLNSVSMSKAIAYTQLVQLSAYHKVTPYQLIAPHMANISGQIVLRMTSAPSGFLEFLSFIGQSQTTFLRATLHYTIPRIFASRQRHLITLIASAIGEDIGRMCMSVAASVLKLLLVAPVDQREAAFRLFEEVVHDAGVTATVSSIARSRQGELLGFLVTRLGSSDDKQAALSGLQWVHETLQRSTRDNLPKYLMGEVLQILAWINEELNNGHGKTSLEEKATAARSVGSLVEVLGTQISSVAPQIMATLNSTLQVDELMRPTLQSWHIFVTTLKFEQVGPFASQTIAAFLSAWPRFGVIEKEIALSMIQYIAVDNGPHFAPFLPTIPSLERIEDDPIAAGLAACLRALQDWSTYPIESIADLITHENSAVCIQALRDLRSFFRNAHGTAFVQSITAGSKFEPIVGKLMHALTTAAHGTDEHQSEIRHLCFECIGILGAADPDRFDAVPEEDRFTLIDNFENEDEAANFALHLVRDVLISAFRAADDTMHQAGLAYAIQELLRVCGFTTALLNPNSTRTVSAKVWQRWESMPKESLEAVTPLLDSRYSVQHGEPSVRKQPFYTNSSDYRDWLQSWTCHLILAVQGTKAQEVFSIFRTLIRDHDLTIAQHILPHLVLSVLISGSPEHREQICKEIHDVLADQHKPKLGFSSERRLLSSQTVFGVMDHIGVWIRDKRFRLIRDRRSNATRTNQTLIDVESVLTSIDSELTASAALKCRAYARALINYEQRVRSLRASVAPADEHSHEGLRSNLQEYYASLHFIYAELDEPDGMEGISTLVVAPSLDHQIREHESTGRWTSAQSCWEVKLQQNPNEPSFHLGLLRCLRSLGHYDTLRTHIRGALSVHPEWKDFLAPYRVEGACILSDWEEVARDVAQGEQSGEHALARVLLAARTGSATQLEQTTRDARRHLGRPIVAAGKHSYSRIYESITQLHMLEEISMISSDSKEDPLDLQKRLSARLNLTLPSFRTREPLLSMRRSAFNAVADAQPASDAVNMFRANVGRAWIQSSKVARRAGHIQTAYSAVLQSAQCQEAFAVVQRAKLLVLEDQTQGAIQILTQGLRMMTDAKQGSAYTADGLVPHYDHAAFLSATLLRARLIDSTSRYDVNYVIERYKEALDSSEKNEKMYYYLGRYYDSCAPGQQHTDPALRSRVCRYFFKSVHYGTKFFYRTLPRFLTLWFEAGEEPQAMKSGKLPDADQPYMESFNSINNLVRKHYILVAQYQWLAMLPQLVSRIAHPNERLFKNLQDIISYVAHTYPSQTMWGMVASAQSHTAARKQRGEKIVQHAMSTAPEGISKHVRRTMHDIKQMAAELLNLCEAPVQRDEHHLYMSKNFPRLEAMAKTRPLLPISNAITVTLPANNVPGSSHNPFPPDLPCIESFDEVIDVLSSLQKPRKLVVRASDGNAYNLLCKPKDDLRKDARLMEFDSMINKLVQRDSEARRRRLYVRTYAVVTLDEECGLIEWVPNTTGFRNILIKLYKARDIPLYTHDIKNNMDEARAKPKEAASIFEQRVLSKYPPVFHEWFLNTWPEPSAWMKARLAYARTLALMSMVGFVLGLGDRHGENILFDHVSGDTVHVDLNCIFEKGQTFEIPERVPFRLTQNFVDAMGVAGYEGVFRRSAEISLRILRENKDSLMSVLETMVHDPLVEWGSDNRSRSKNAKGPDPRMIEARKALDPIGRKLDGILAPSTYSRGGPAQHAGHPKVYTTNHLVDVLIREATSSSNLSQMYVGWAPYL